MKNLRYVDLWSRDEVNKAISMMHGMNLMGRNINVDDATRCTCVISMNVLSLLPNAPEIHIFSMPLLR